MTAPYRIFGNEMSPYSVKVRAWFRYKAIPHLWLQRSQHREEFEARARLPLIPLVVTLDDRALQDSTPVIEALEAEYPEPSIHPEDPALRFLSALIEEYGDEWGNKLMFHHRWHSEVDRRATALVLARSFLPNEEVAAVEALAEQVRERMVGRVHFTGSSEANAPLISRYLDDLLAILEAHLESRKYLFGARPAFADFGLAPQLYEAALDPTAAGIIRARAPKVLAWSYRVLEPHNEGPFENWQNLKETLTPLLANAGAFFLPWSHANALALETGEESFSVDLPGGAYVQGPQKYHARSLIVLRQKYRAAEGAPGLEAILAETGCLVWLQ